MPLLFRMKMIVRCFAALLIATASFAFGSAPEMTVVVSNSSGKAIYKGATDAKGTFATAELQPGSYVVQVAAKRSADVTGKNFAVVISAGKKKVAAESIAGEKFNGAGVAMRIEVGAGANIAGQVTSAITAKVDKNGKKLVWIAPKLGSHLPGHWAAADSAEAKEAMTAGTISRENIQERQNQGIAPASQ
jgi:Carboxypeptidase regulatory-like domain